MGETDNGFATAASVREHCKERVVEVEGEKYRIRRVGPAEMIELGGSPSLEGYLPGRRQRTVEAPTGEEAEKQGLFFDRLVSRCVTSMEILEADEPAREGAIHVGELSPEIIAALGLRILHHSEHNVREAFRVRPS